MPFLANSDAAPQAGIVEKRFNISVAGRQLEALQLTGAKSNAPTIVFLHEGLGSISLWRDFPHAVVAATGCSALIYSRYGYGQSDMLCEARKPDYMHREALDVLPALLKKSKIENPILFGHSDGASIALIHAGAGHDVAGIIVEAPHLFVEAISLRGVAQAAESFRRTDLPKKLARHHRDAEKTFWGWHDVWASGKFRDWNIETYVSKIRVPILSIQGEQDDYGSAEQVLAIRNACPSNSTIHLLRNCGHAPHTEQFATTLELLSSFVTSL